HHTVAENHPSRARAAASSIRLRNTYQNGRISMSSDRIRYHHPPLDAGFPDQFMPRSLMFMNHPGVLFGSRALFDQHRAMRLDIDNMTYEELLALGDRIGTVSTGLCDNSISECLAASAFRLTDE
ncbi:zinc finger family protein, partial [Genlisea aurea]